MENERVLLCYMSWEFYKTPFTLSCTSLNKLLRLAGVSETITYIANQRLQHASQEMIGLI